MSDVSGNVVRLSPPHFRQKKIQKIKTSTMATVNRKRPAPSSTSNGGTTNGVGPSSTSLRIDALLAKYARNLPPGGSVSIQLIKGPTSSSADPIAIRKIAAKKNRQLERSQQRQQQQHQQSSGFSSGMSSGNDSDGNNGSGTTDNNNTSAATATAIATAKEKLTLSFPRIAKFSETTSKPNFAVAGGGGSGGSGGGLRDGRMYEEEVPLAKVSDERNHLYVNRCYCLGLVLLENLMYSYQDIERDYIRMTMLFLANEYYITNHLQDCSHATIYLLGVSYRRNVYYTVMSVVSRLPYNFILTHLTIILFVSFI